MPAVTLAPPRPIRALPPNQGFGAADAQMRPNPRPVAPGPPRIETIAISAHIPPMSTAAKDKPVARPKARIYRGIKLQRTYGKSRFTAEEIRKAVTAAVAKNADALATGK